MRNVSSAFMDALLSGRDRGIVPRRFLHVTARDRTTGAPAGIGLWTGDEDINVTLTSGVTGQEVTRTYYGARNLVIPTIPRVSDMTIQTITVTMSQIADAVQQLIRGYDVRLAKAEIHDGLLDPVTRQLVAPPELSFLGEVDGAPIETPAVGGEGKASLKLVSDAISMLARKNPRKSSYEGQKRRDGDEWGLYASTVATWKIPWGQKS
jgi:hypothetical protein